MTWMTKCFILLLAIRSSDSAVKHLRIEDFMEDLFELQVVVGLWFLLLLHVLQTLWMRVRDLRTVEKL